MSIWSRSQPMGSFWPAESRVPSTHLYNICGRFWSACHARPRDKTIPRPRILSCTFEMILSAPSEFLSAPLGEGSAFLSAPTHSFLLLTPHSLPPSLPPTVGTLRPNSCTPSSLPKPFKGVPSGLGLGHSHIFWRLHTPFDDPPFRAKWGAVMTHLVG